MPAAAATVKSPVRSLIEFVHSLVRPVSRRLSAGASRDSTDPSKVDLGDLAVAQLVHDLRNQLTVILVCVDDLTRVVPNGPLNPEIVLLRRCAARTSVLTREILLAARPRFAARRPLDLNHVVAPVAEMLSRIASDRVQIKIHLSPVPVAVVAEFIELERIVINLVLNAFDATAEGVITIETEAVRSPSSSRVEGIQHGPYARLTVTDTGGGVSPEIRARMFEPFFTTKETGTGLGLSSVAFTVRELQGTVAVDSESGRGTSITVILPLAS